MNRERQKQRENEVKQSVHRSSGIIRERQRQSVGSGLVKQRVGEQGRRMQREGAVGDAHGADWTTEKGGQMASQTLHCPRRRTIFLCIYSILLCIVIILYVMIKRMDKLIVPTVMPHRQTN